MEYHETGNKIAVPTEELIKYIHKQLNNYENSIHETQSLGLYNPYSQPIIYKTTNGKTIKVPQEIKKYAIDLWHKMNGTNVPLGALQGVPVMLQESADQQLVENFNNNYNSYNNATNLNNLNTRPRAPDTQNYINIFVVALICIFLIYYFVK